MIGDGAWPSPSSGRITLHIYSNPRPTALKFALVLGPRDITVLAHIRLDRGTRGRVDGIHEGRGTQGEVLRRVLSWYWSIRIL